MPLIFHEKMRRSPGSRLVIGLEGIDEAKVDEIGEVADKRRRFAGGGEISGLFILLCYFFIETYSTSNYMYTYSDNPENIW